MREVTPVRERRGARLLVVLLLLVINLPLLHGSYLAWQLHRSGERVTAGVVGTQEVSPRGDVAYVVELRFDRDVDPGQRTWTAQVDRTTYDAARGTGTIDVRVVPGHPSNYRADGETGGGLGLVLLFTVVADTVVIGFVALLWGYRRGVGRLHLVATADVQRSKPGASVAELADGICVVVGEVSEIDADGIVLDLGDRTVRVDLDGHRNPVGYQQPARVTGRLADFDV